MTRTLPLSEVKIKFSQLVDAVVRRDDEVIITRSGRPVAVLLSVHERDSWRETQEIVQNPELMEEIRAGLKAIQRGQVKRYSLDELFGASVG